ncbi:flagellar hook capping FlgD N-terminal domain-containing protein [uncultured Tateyamaria sp.]|uniref:flagellar hook capping FlgD N-terminal domain-containing protein n=1 Tax=uncultured Tateyamaria sp. TaxID=455651 RepID=UPI002622E26A|nr:flagellar hook capping FlgD N-terminal domain-containing protein [uncultured Tateyamaria sp.]
MDILPTPAAAATATAAIAPSSAVLSSDFEVFLQMLTAQAEYQDPLEPIDSSEYASQLAQFSMVEQQVTTNDLMEQILSALGANDMASAANWIGMEALVQGPAKFEGTPVTIAPNPPITADEVTLIVTNAQGTEVQRQAMPLGAEPYLWDGRKADGSSFAHGEYSFQIESKSNGEVLLTEPALAYTRVTEARVDNGSTLLVLGSGYLIDAANVLGLREPA